MRFEYFIFILFIFLSSMIGVLLYPRAKIPSFRKYLIAVLIVNIPYLVWDQIVTGYWWHFNERYIIGTKIFKLPLEEVLFFFVVPWSCLVLWVNLKDRIKGGLNFPSEKFLIIFALLFLAWAYLNSRWYTVAISFGLVIILSLSEILGGFLRKRNVIFFLAVVFFLTLIFNGYLTSRPVILYNTNFLSGIYLYTIPIEDFLYGLLMMVIIVFLYEQPPLYIVKISKIMRYLPKFLLAVKKFHFTI